VELIVTDFQRRLLFPTSFTDFQYQQLLKSISSRKRSTAWTKKIDVKSNERCRSIDFITSRLNCLKGSGVRKIQYYTIAVLIRLVNSWVSLGLVL